MTGLHPLLVAGSAVVASSLAGTLVVSQTRLAVPTSSARALHLTNHATEADLVRKAVIRGDLIAVREPARRLADQIATPDMAPGNPAATDALRQAALSGAEAPDLPHAAFASARIAAACGSCHQASNVHTALRTQGPSTVGGVVGHMIEHQQAADELLAGLVEPSDRLWQEGAAHLERAPLKRDKLPRDSRLTDDVLAEEQRIHQLAARAREVPPGPERTELYAQVLSSCAECHALHQRVWGPSALR